MTCRAVEIPEAPGALATRMLLGLLLTLGPAALASAATGHGGEVNLVSVSYTHLDVYKRQPQRRR